MACRLKALENCKEGNRLPGQGRVHAPNRLRKLLKRVNVDEPESYLMVSPSTSVTALEPLYAGPIWASAPMGQVANRDVVIFGCSGGLAEELRTGQVVDNQSALIAAFLA
jgi:hypothetical protein